MPYVRNKIGKPEFLFADVHLFADVETLFADVQSLFAGVEILFAVVQRLFAEVAASYLPT